RRNPLTSPLEPVMQSLQLDKHKSVKSDISHARRAFACVEGRYREPRNQRSIGLPMPRASKGIVTFRPSPADAYAAYKAFITCSPSSPVDWGSSLPRTQRAKCAISCGKP